MRFDWRRFCQRNGIEFVEYGPNTARGNISIHCPFCGAADRSQHMGLKLDINDPQWGCLRNASHRAPDPTRLVAALLGISYKQAAELLKADAPPPDSLGDMLHSLRQPAQNAPDRAQTRRAVRMPAEFAQLGTEPPTSYQQRFLDYLSGRGFGSDALDAAKRYGLRYALTGEQAWRLIFPVYGESGELIGWTGREIRPGGTNVIRYRAMPEMGKDWLMLSPCTEPADVLLVCEGPLDFLKLDYYGREFGVEATGTMGTAITPAQFLQLVRKARKYRRVYSVFDPEAFAQSMRLVGELDGLACDARFHQLPIGYEDPGAMTKGQVWELSRLLSHRE